MHRGAKGDRCDDPGLEKNGTDDIERRGVGCRVEGVGRRLYVAREVNSEKGVLVQSANM